ncbi:MAG: methyltransferase domain-containing protein [Gemmataceae bacterium]|nr:methyltransferase domain-containing protein [Gemmataceae bacterium]
MIPRVLEPEVMDSEGEALEYDQMDHSAVNRAFAADFLRLWNSKNPLLDVGTGTAQIPIEICRQDSRPVFTAVDLAPSMLKLADRNVALAGLVNRIFPKLVDAKGLPYADGEFGGVVSNSIIHHIPEPAAALREMVRVCASGGCLFVRDLMRPTDHPELRRLVDLHAAGANDRQRQLFADSLHASLTLAEVRELVASLGFAPDTVQATSDRHWTWAAVR